MRYPRLLGLLGDYWDYWDLDDDRNACKETIMLYRLLDSPLWVGAPFILAVGLILFTVVFLIVTSLHIIFDIVPTKQRMLTIACLVFIAFGYHVWSRL